ncbi:uncharacterized protein [Aquarana catesbeiana]|uniref:uncharacterized protein n=1 Tax=Aquarana catesbeiana TaxID=8400 RepID=UPI003CC94611
MRLFIVISLYFLGITGSPVCVHQMTTRTVQSGGSVTIPCSYANPGKPDEDVRVIWRETDQQLCSSTAAEDTIISHSGNVTEKYKGRLYREKDPNRNRTEYITITGLKPTDGPRFCCQLYDIRYGHIFKDSGLGTLLQFPGTEYITQLDEVMAVSREDVIIPCYYSKDISDIIKVTWYYADRGKNDCTHIALQEWRKDQYFNSRYSLVNFTQDISLRIRNIDVTYERSYCCVISTSTARATLESKQFTRLIVAEYQSSWNQPTNNIILQEGHSVTLPCSYTLPSGRSTERDVVRVNVYWRVGNVTGPYAYHPYQDMVHSTYRHRTSMTGMTNLMINDVTKADNTSFHCFVVVKRCAGDYRYDDDIQYGGGTRLIIKEPSEPPQMSSFGQEALVLAAYVAVKFFIAVILVVLGCVYGRAKNTKRST